MFNRTSETGWFEYNARDVPEPVVEHLQTRSDVVNLTRDGNEVTFLSDNGTLPQDLYDEDGDDGFEDYGVMSSSPVDQPSDLPDNLTNNITIDAYVDNATLAEFIEALGMGRDDPREYALNGRFSLSLDAWRDREHEPSQPPLEPMPFEMVEEADAAGLVQDNSMVDYPSVAEMREWAEAFDSVFDETALYAIGDIRAEQVMIDGVVVRVDVTDEVRNWVREKFDGDAEFSRATEVQFYDDEWVRLWWD